MLLHSLLDFMGGRLGSKTIFKMGGCSQAKQIYARVNEAGMIVCTPRLNVMTPREQQAWENGAAVVNQAIASPRGVTSSPRSGALNGSNGASGVNGTPPPTFITEVSLFHSRTLRNSKQPGPDDIVVGNERRPLPAFIHLPAINDSILTQAPFAQESGEQKFWWGVIACEEHQRLLADAFWFGLAHVVQKKPRLDASHGSSSASQDSSHRTSISVDDGYLHLDKSVRFTRIANNYVSMMKEVPMAKAHSFKQHYEEILAYALLLCYQAAFPSHVESMRSTELVNKILDLCREWLRGFRPSRNRFSTRNGGAWIAKCINVMDRKDGPLPKFLLTPDKMNGNGRPRGHYVPLVTQRVRYKLQHSPLIDRYLANHSEKDLPHLGCRMTWTEEPGAPLRTMVSNKRELSQIRLRRVPKYRSVPNLREEVQTASETRRRMVSEYETGRQEIRKEVFQIQRGRFDYKSRRPVTREMEALMAAGDVHELSNYLVSNLKIWSRTPPA